MGLRDRRARRHGRETIPAGPRAPLPEPPGLLRGFVWLIWCLLARPLRPALFLLLVAGGVFFVWRAAGQSEFAPGSGPEIHQTYASSLQGRDVRAVWELEVARALDPLSQGRPDLDLSRSLLAALPILAGEERLALDILSETRPRALVEADLRARPAWQRQRRMARAYDAHLARAGAAGLDPPELIFAGEPVQLRYRRAAALYDRTHAAAGRWFLDPQERTLRLDALAGFGDEGDPVLLHGDVSALVGEGCAAARANRLALAGCSAPVLAGATADPVALTLAALVQASSQDIEREGARLLLAAQLSGRLQPGLADIIRGSRGEGEQVLTALVDWLHEAESIAAQPARHAGPAADAAREAFSRQRLASLSALARQTGRLGREAGSLAALRLLEHAGTPVELERLAGIAEDSGSATLALFSLSGTGADQWLSEAAPVRRPSPLANGPALIAMVCFALALLLALSAPAGRLLDRVRGRPGGLRRIDDWARGLILGRKA